MGCEKKRAANPCTVGPRIGARRSTVTIERPSCSGRRATCLLGGDLSTRKGSRTARARDLGEEVGVRGCGVDQGRRRQDERRIPTSAHALSTCMVPMSQLGAQAPGAWRGEEGGVTTCRPLAAKEGGQIGVRRGQREATLRRGLLERQRRLRMSDREHLGLATRRVLVEAARTVTADEAVAPVTATQSLRRRRPWLGQLSKTPPSSTSGCCASTPRG